MTHCSLSLFYIIELHAIQSQFYVLQTEHLSIGDSEALCVFNYEQHLASIHNLTQFTEANVTREMNDVWIGLKEDSVINDIWTYTDTTLFDYGNSPYEQSPPWNKNPDQPDDTSHNENCVEMHQLFNGYWNDAPCWALKYALCNYPQPTYVINDPLNYQRIPLISNAIGTIDILDEIYIEFDIIIHSWSQMFFATVLHFSDRPDRYFPVIYVHGYQHKFYAIFSLVTDDLSGHSSNMNSIDLDTLYHVIYHQTQNHLTFTFNSTVIYNDDISSHSIVMNQTIYFSSPWTERANVTISNLLVTTSNSYVPNSFNYICEGENRWTPISGVWTFDSCAITQHNSTINDGVVWLGTNDPLSIDWTDYKIEVKLKLNNGNIAGILFRQNISHNNGIQYYWLGLIRSSSCIQLGKMNYTLEELTRQDGININLDIEYTLRIEVISHTFDIYFENEFLFTYGNSDYKFGSVGLRTDKSSATFTSIRIMFPSHNNLVTVNPTTSPTYVPTNNPTYQSISNSPTTSSPTIIPTGDPTVSPINDDIVKVYTTIYQETEGDSENRTTDMKNNLIIGIIIVVLICICIGVISMLFCIKKRRKSTHKNDIEMNISSISYVDTNRNLNRNSGCVDEQILDEINTSYITAGGDLNDNDETIQTPMDNIPSIIGENDQSEFEIVNEGEDTKGIEYLQKDEFVVATDDGY
eukprot:182421_1